MSALTPKPKDMPEDFYQTEVIEAYNVAINALEAHEPADGDPTGIALKLRACIGKKLDRECQRWLRRRTAQPDAAGGRMGGEG